MNASMREKLGLSEVENIHLDAYRYVHLSGHGKGEGFHLCSPSGESNRSLRHGR